MVDNAMTLSRPSQPTPSRKAVTSAMGPLLPLLQSHKAKYETNFIRLLFVLDTVLVDDDVEVRDLASMTLSGLICQAPLVASVGREKLLLDVLVSGSWGYEGRKLIYLYAVDLALGSDSASKLPYTLAAAVLLITINSLKIQEMVLETQLANENVLFVHESDNLHREALQDAQLGCLALSQLLAQADDVDQLDMDDLIAKLEANVSFTVELAPKLDLPTLPRRPDVFILFARHLMLCLALVQNIKRNDYRRERVVNAYRSLKLCLVDFFIFDDLTKLIDLQVEGDLTRPHSCIDTMYSTFSYSLDL